MKSFSVPNPAVKRLSLYLRRLEQLAEEGTKTVSSRQLAESLRLSDAQVRKDLTYFGQFGRPGVGYEVRPLVEELRRILGTDRVRSVVLIGVGDLGRALLRYRGFPNRGFEIVAAFDIAQDKIGRDVGAVRIRHLDELGDALVEYDLDMAIMAVPPHAAQEVADRLCEAGIGGILNFAPTTLNTPRKVAVFSVDLAASMEQLSFQVHTRK